jgi:alpha-glucosidase
MRGNFNTPWRTIMAGTSQPEILENNYLLLNLNEPNKIANTSWIKPGKVIREVTLTSDGAKACIEFASKHNLQYVEFDAGWYGPEHDPLSDASTVTIDPKRSKGPLDLPKIIDYANSKEIGIILYVNHSAMEKQLDQILPIYQEWGIKGLKYGFVNVGSRQWTGWLHEAVRKAAKYELMVDIHDEYRPTGYSRTYPNLMTQEGIRGDEESPSTEHTLTTLFTRMLAGAGDNTNCYLAPRVVEKMGGKTAQMAKAIMIYSPWQFLYWYDRPADSPHKTGGAGSAETLLKENPELSFYDALPTVWDDIKVIEGEIGEFATIARRSGTEWFIGSLAANNNRTIEIPLSFLDSDKKYIATVYSQNSSGLKNNKAEISEITVTAESVLSREIIRNSGIAIIIREI